ncbi:PREDICTED: serine/threonine-protein kinase fray2 isoform X2 [Nicotiana attenuata]|uniref:serine/threonine-protein kinase fray2 isoform X2 n=1 Tax=Nicotiana attenuata TaxID=49451 RepID=UPI000904799A|nr:PREDICTED: serine/threonine-protein kinase fray2 isoform X2 [Nicotiana attenuata]
MEEEKAAAYYDELTRKGEGAAKFKQGLGFSSTSNNDAVPSRGSALVSSSSFLSSFVRASSPSKTTEFEKQAQLQSIQNKLKLKKKPKDDENYDSSLSSRVSSKGKNSRSRSPSRERHSRRRSRSPSRTSKRRSRSRDKERHSRRRNRSRSRSRSRSRDAYRSNRRYRSRSRSKSRDRGKYREKEKKSRRRSRSVSPRDRRSEKDRAATVDYSKLIEGYEIMTPAERVKAKMKLQLSETARKDETKGMGSGWERFDFDKDAPLDEEEIEAAEDDVALVNHIGKSFRFSAVETRREEQIKAAHDEAIFGVPSLLPLPPSTETDYEAEEDNGKKDISETAPATSLISGQVIS